MQGRLINQKQANFICRLLTGKNVPIMKVAAHCRLGYETAYKVVRRLEEKGLVMVGKKGRVSVITPTVKGEEMCTLLNKLMFILN